MTKRFLLSIALAAASAFALTFATPTYACGKDCDCAKKSATEQPQKKDASPTKGDQKKAATTATGAVRVAANATCNCEKGGKGCTCPKGQCECANCKAQHKHTHS